MKTMNLTRIWAVIGLMLASSFSALGQTASILPNGQTQFVDGNGSPYAGGSVYFYVPSTTTPKNTYKDPLQVVPNTNPVILDSNGRAIIWGQGEFREVLQDINSNTIWDQLTYGFNPSTFASLGNGCLLGNNSGVAAAPVCVTVGSGLTLSGSSNTSLSATPVYYTVVPDSTNQAVVLGFNQTQHVATGALTYTLPLASGLVNGFGFWLYALNATVTITPNIVDNFQGSVAGASITLASGAVAFISTNANSPGTWYEQLITTPAASINVAAGSINGYLPSSIAGANNTATMTIATGSAADSTGAQYVNFSVTHSWAVANGNAVDGFQGGSSLPNSTTIHMFDCHGTSGDTSFASTSLTPTCPVNFNSLYRRIFSFFTNASGAPVNFTPDEGAGGSMTAYLATPVLDISAQTPTTANRTLYTMSIPTGVKVQWMGLAIGNISASGQFIWLTSPDEPDTAPGTVTTNPLFDWENASTTQQITTVSRRASPFSNTNGQIGIRAGSSTGAIYGSTTGWVDNRRSMIWLVGIPIGLQRRKKNLLELDEEIGRTLYPLIPIDQEGVYLDV
jgi:hypothetical protein